MRHNDFELELYVYEAAKNFFLKKKKPNQKNDNFVMVLGDFYFGTPRRTETDVLIMLRTF